MVPLVANWSFTPSSPSLSSRLSRLKSAMTGRKPRPAVEVIRPFTPAARWNVLFVYLPDGHLSEAQQFSLSRLASLTGRLGVIAAISPNLPLPEGLILADALVRKDLGGYDFSAYTIASEQIAEHSPGARMFFQNDSVFGPFGDIDRLVENAPCELTGFLASSTLENHIQSFAFVIQSLDAACLDALRPVMPHDFAFDRYRDVVNLQETRMARIAARRMTVGAYWFAPDSGIDEPSLAAGIRRKLARPVETLSVTADASLIHAVALLETGFPFMKRSLFGRNRHLGDRATLISALQDQGHPVAGL